MSAFFCWSNITKQSLMIFQCHHFVAEAILQNSHSRVSNVPILSLKQHYKTVADDILMSPFCRWKEITKESLMICPHFVAEAILQNRRSRYSNIPILLLKRHYADNIPMSPFCRLSNIIKTVADDIPMCLFCRWSNTTKLSLKIFKIPLFSSKKQHIFFWNSATKSGLSKNVSDTFGGAMKKKFQQQMCDCQNSLRT